MKNIFAVTACLKRCSVAALYNGELFEVNENADAAANLVWLADELCKSKNISLKNIDGVITSSGPGSFTGIRTAQSFVKGLSLSLKIPSLSVSYFDVIKSIFGKDEGNLAAVIKSEKNQVYYKVFSNGEVGVSSYENLPSILPKDTFLIGDAVYEIPGFAYWYFSDFKEAKHLLHFVHSITSETFVAPLYINAQKA